MFCDDLSFSSADEIGYQALKSVLDGSAATPADNLLIVATSNRRHLMPEPIKDNLDTTQDCPGGEIHPGEAIEEKISLSERFGLWISFYPFGQDEYLAIVECLAAAFRHRAQRGAAQPGPGLGAGARFAQRPRRPPICPRCGGPFRVN